MICSFPLLFPLLFPFPPLVPLKWASQEIPVTAVIVDDVLEQVMKVQNHILCPGERVELLPLTLMEYLPAIALRASS